MLNTTHFNIQFLTKFYTKKDKISLKTCHFETIPYLLISFLINKWQMTRALLTAYRHFFKAVPHHNGSTT